jgi:hypothetical protein
MKMSCRPLALLGASVSVLALGAASPALAATGVSPGIGHSDTTDPVDDELVICELDDGCFFGVDANGSGLVSASVPDVASGRIEQIGSSTAGAVDLNLTNDGDAEIGAHAVAAPASGYASAYAMVLSAIHQSGTGVGRVALDLTNDGTLLSPRPLRHRRRKRLRRPHRLHQSNAGSGESKPRMSSVSTMM